MAIAPHQPPNQGDQRAELVLHQLESLPTLPAVAVRVLEMTGDGRANARDLTTLIESDPALTARILRIVHRSDGGIRADINSIERAVVFLGFEAVRNAVLAVGVFEAFGPASSQDRTPPNSAGGKRFDRTAFWKHCVAVACMAELLAEACSRQSTVGSPSTTLPAAHHTLLSPSDAFVAGLLHDLGKVAIDAALPKSFARVVDAVEMTRGDIADVERAVIGLDHMTVGKRLAERWMLPAMLRDSIWLHGQSPAALPAVCRHPRLVNVVTLADIVVRQQHLGFSGNHAFNVPIAGLLEAIGLTQAQLDAATAQLVARLEPRARSLGLGEATSEDLYRDALKQANRELGRMTDQLATKNRKLAVRAKFFETLSAFHGELRPDAPPATVLFAIAQTAAQSLDTPATAVYSINANGADVIVVSRDGDVLARDAVSDFRFPVTDVITEQSVTADRKPEVVSRAGDDFEWLTSRIAPKLGGAALFTITLASEGLPIGGVVWGANADEQTRLATQSHELSALASGWGLALRTCQIRDESKALSEQLADANRRLTGAQDEIMRARTLATIGEMAAGAAHEMNNPLAVIAGRSQLLSLQLADGKHAASARLVAEQAQRLSDIITELMDFARPTPATTRSCQVGELLNRAIALAQATGELADTRVELLTPIGTDCPPVRADAGQVAAAIAEVLVNAAQSMGGVDGASRSIRLSAAHDRYGDQVVLSVSDAGCGMDDHVLSRAFDPFYSAKSAGRRRGMGLAKALRWVEGSGGRMRLESKPGEGSRMAIALKVASAIDDVRSASAAGEQQKIA